MPIFASTVCRMGSICLTGRWKMPCVDATLIHTPSSTKKRERARDPEMHQTKKGKHGHFGMKVHAGADVDSGAAHTVEIAAANEADINILSKQLWVEDEVTFGDTGYTSDEYKRGARQFGFTRTRTAD